MNIKYCLITLMCGSFAIASTASAQDTPKVEQPTTLPPSKSAEKKDGKNKKKEGEKTDKEKKAEALKKEAEKKAAEAAIALEEAKAAAAQKAAAEAEKPEEENGGFSPIAELADKDFVPMKEINEEELEQIIPGRVHPRVDWSGLFRLRTGLRNNFDLDTEGTSRVLPPVESYAPTTANPADSEADSHWSTNLSLRIEPTIFITEDIKIHTEIAMLNNLILGSLPTGENSVNPLQNSAASSSQFSGNASDLFQNLLEINELYGEVNTIFATLYAGRMDDVWGLGMYTSDGDCNDCNYGNHVDRAKLQTNLFGFYLTGTWDFPNEGVTTRSPFSFGGQPYDVSQIDDADQWTFSVEKVARTREELEIQSDALLNEKAWIPEGGIQYRYQSQEGAFVKRSNETFDPDEPPSLIYRGASVHVVDAWGRLIYQPEEDRFIKINIEALGAFGNVDNVTNTAVGEPDNNEAVINCFDEDVRTGNQERCTSDSAGNSTKRSITQFGLALESEFRFNSPVTFGLNGGFASGGKSQAWGTRGDVDLDFFRFNPDYHVDLILFREVIGTVTNAYYVNPNINLRFFETSGRHLELNVDAIFSGVIEKEGGVASDGLLGFELDAGISYIMRDLFTATIEGGILFPFDGLAAESGRARYTGFGSNSADFTQNLSPTIPWTIQGKLYWNF